MDSDEKVSIKALGSNTSSTAVSNPIDEGYISYDAKLQSLQDKNEHVRAGISKLSSPELTKASTMRRCTNLEAKKLSTNHSTMISNKVSLKQSIKRENPDTSRSWPATPWICKNLACKASLSAEDTFCKRCSCCICHRFDDNKDPSCWLVCTSESGGDEWCESSCHIECALQHQKAGVVDCGQFMKLDGNYCCPACGKISGILGSWKKQMILARDARRIDILCHRIFLSYRLLNGTSRFKELHEIVEDAKAKLEIEVGPLDGVSARMARGIVSRLSIAGDMHRLCSRAIEKADEYHETIKQRDSLPVACRFQFQEIASTSLVVVLKEPFSVSASIKGFKLWYYESKEDPCQKEPVIISTTNKRVLIYNLQPCTEYTFRIISFTEEGDLGHSESKCFTKSAEIIQKKSSRREVSSSSAKREANATTSRSSGFRIRDLGKILQRAWAEEDGCDCYNEHEVEEERNQAQPSVVARRLNLNTVLVPDLNIDATPSNGSADSQGPVGEVPAVESQPKSRKRSVNATEETCDGDSTQVNGPPLLFPNGPGQLDDNFEYCVKVVRWLECSDHVDKTFRMKFLTWFSMRSSEQERKVVITFIRTLKNDPSSLATQLIDSFHEVVTCKRPRNGLCNEFWH